MRAGLMCALAVATAGATERRELQSTDTQCTASNIDDSEQVYFDVASLTCTDCPGALVRSSDGLYCECDRDAANPCAGYEEEEDCPCVSSSTEFEQFASRDGMQLMVCQDWSGTVPDSEILYSTTAAVVDSAKDCACAEDNHRLVEFSYTTPIVATNGEGDDAVDVTVHGEKRCIECPPLTYVDQAVDPYECLPCPAPDGSSVSGCGCATGEVNAQGDSSLGECIEETWLNSLELSSVTSSYYKMEYTGVDNGEVEDAEVDVLSSTFQDVFWPHVVACYRVLEAFQQEAGPVQLERTQSCQALANLCVLQDYNKRPGGVCALFEDGGKLATLTPDIVNGETEWQKHLPWLYRDAKIRSSTDKISLKVGFDAQPEEGIVRTLQFKLAAYSLDGTWLGFEDVTTQLDVCSGLPFGTAGNHPDYLNIGYGINKECTLDVTSLLAAATAPVQKFYDLYLVDATGELVPTATKLLNYRDYERSNEFVNVDSNEDEDVVNEQFTGRFMLFDRLSALRAADAQYPRVFRYAKSVKLSVKITELGKVPSIFTPIVTIEYGAIDVDKLLEGEWDDGAVVDLSFRTEYIKDLETYKSTLRVIFAVCCTLAVCEWGISIVLHSRNRPSGAVDGPFLVRTLFDGIGCAARWMFLLMFFGCFQQWFFFKMQAEVNTMLPTDNDIEPFRVMLSTGFIAKLISLAHVLWRQCQADVFFVDWEKSHGRLVDAVSDGGEDGEKKDVMAPVSCWRTLFITNEWAELQTVRGVNVELTLLGLVFLLRGCDLDNLATSNPDIEDLRGPEDGGSSIDPVLHFFIGSFFIILLSGAQIAFNTVFYYRFVRPHPLDVFSTLLDTANLSAVILSDVHCGYYVGGVGAPHSHMDTDMYQLRKNLEKEGQGLRAPRGLAAKQGVSYIMFVTPEIRRTYEGQFFKLVENAQRRGGPPDDKGLLNAYSDLNKMFKKFVTTKDHRDPKYAKDFLPMTSGMRLLPMYNPEIAKLNKTSLFYEDTQQSWQSVVLCGIEGQLMILLCWSFTWFHFMTEHTTAAACFTYVLHLAMTRYRMTAGLKNVVRKTLVDERFLT